MEHRWGVRVPTDRDVRIFADPASAGWGRLRDVSISGGFVETALKIPPLSTLSLTLPAARPHRARTLHAIAVRSNADGVGVEWFGIDADAVAALMQEAGSWHGLTHLVDEMHL